MAFYNHLSSTMQEDSKHGVSASQRRHARRALRVSDSVQSQERLDKSALSQLEAIDKGERTASVTDSQQASPRYKARSVSRHKVGDSDTPRFKFSTNALDAVLQDVNSTFAFTRKSEVPGADLTITYYTSIHLDSDAERECNCHPRLATAISTSQSSPDDIVAIQFKLVNANGARKDVIMENTITTAAEAGGVLTLSHIKDAIQSFTLHAYTSLDEVKSAFADTFMGDSASMEASQEVSDAADSEKPIAAGDTVYASSPKLETLQGVPLEVVKVREGINLVVVKLPDGKTRSLPLSYVKR